MQKAEVVSRVMPVKSKPGLFSKARTVFKFAAYMTAFGTWGFIALVARSKNGDITTESHGGHWGIVISYFGTTISKASVADGEISSKETSGREKEMFSGQSSFPKPVRDENDLIDDQPSRNIAAGKRIRK